MKIILDAMGGDNAPDANIKGAINAINKVKAEVILVGKEEVIRKRVKELYGKEIEEISDRLKIKNASKKTKKMQFSLHLLIKFINYAIISATTPEPTVISINCLGFISS